MRPIGPRLLLHAGTPKTGTTTLQHALYEARAALHHHGILYADVDLSHELKHQWMVNLLMAGDIHGFRRNVLSVVDAARTTGAAQVVLSTEGLFHHWTDFTPDARRELSTLATLFDITVWAVFREPVSFATSLYSQLLKNPPLPHLTACYATTMSLDEAVRDPWFATRLDYARFIIEIEQLFGRRCLVATKYEAVDTVAQARALLGVDERVLPGVPVKNQGLNALGVDLLRRLNATAVDPVERQRLVDAVVDIDRVLGRSERFTPSPQAQQAICNCARASANYLADRFAIHWDVLEKQPQPVTYAVGCVADSRSPFLEQALRLLQSWRWFAGAYADAPFYVCVVDGVTDEWRQRYERLGAVVHIVPRFRDRHSTSNKLRFLEIPEAQLADRVLLLDCDTIVVQSPERLFTGEGLTAKIADVATVPLEVFAQVFDRFGLTVPTADQECTVSGEPMIPYFNSGVISLSGHAMRLLAPAWVTLNGELTASFTAFGGVAHFCEQASLSLALAVTRVPFITIGNELNFPAHFDGVNMPAHVNGDILDSPLGRVDPTIIHYHWLVQPDGTLSPSIYPRVDRRIQEFNRRWLEAERTETQK